MAGVRHFGMEVVDGIATCFYRGRAVLKTKMPEDVYYRGGIAIKTWDPVKNTSNVIIRSLIVTPVVADKTR
jgi:hypothetical protein